MIVIDRIILSQYSSEAFNACFGVIQWYWAFLCTALEFILIAEVFVGQYNGAQRHREIGPIVWQMIWFCLILLFLYVPLACLVTPYLIADNIAELGVPYLRIIVIFIPIHCIGSGALTAFFVGRGETKIIPIIAVISNVLNAVLDYFFIFGLKIGTVQIIPEGGIIGAAIATVTAQIIPVFLLFALFLKKNHRERFGTSEMAFKFDLLKNCLKIATPATLNRFINSVFWATMTQVVVQHVTANDFQGYGIVHSIYTVFSFAIEGTAAGTRTICSNAIGARTFSIVRKNINAWLLLGGIFIALFALGIVGYSKELIGIFLGKGKSNEVYFFAYRMLSWTLFVFILDYVVNNLQSILLSSGDTKFTMFVNTICFFCFAVLPTYIGIVYFHCESILFWKFTLLDCVVRILFFTLRYRSGRWIKKQLI
jgi:MATE family multidrug resistance protein